MMDDVRTARIAIELLELATGRPLKTGEPFDLNDLRKVIHGMRIKEIHKEDETVSVEVFAVNNKTYTMRLSPDLLRLVTTH